MQLKSKIVFLLSLSFCLLFSPFGLASTSLNPKAPIGGTFTRSIGGEPTTLHPLSSNDFYSEQANLYIHDFLAYRNPETNEFAPRLAEKWEVSKDQKVYTFHLRKDAVFHDGQPVTSSDVKFSFDAIFDPAYKSPLQTYYDRISKVEVVDTLTVKFYLKDTYFHNFIAIAGLYILPRHVYEDVEKSKKMTKTAVGAGPYQLDKFEKGSRIVLKRFDKWYGFNSKEWKGAYNFATLQLKFVSDSNAQLDLLKKGELDYAELSADSFVKKTEGALWGQAIIKNKVENRSPRQYGFIGWNFRKEIFQDKNVRWALAQLLNRPDMIEKFRYGMSVPATGPTYQQSEDASPRLTPIPFDPKKAIELLNKAGWKDSDKDGILDKVINGKKVDFKFTLLYANKDYEKYAVVFKEDLKKAGIEMELKLLDWTTFVKNLDEGNFDAVAMGWSTTLDWDPKQVWHSSNAIHGGSNFIAYKNPLVDKLIDDARMEMNKKKRLSKLHKIYEMIAADMPYAFLFNDKFQFYANSNKVQKPGDTFPFEIGYDYWWALQP